LVAIPATDRQLEEDSDERIASKHSRIGRARGCRLVAALTTPAFATISNPAADQRMLVGGDVVAPVVAGVEPASEPKVPLIRVAPRCPGCYGLDDDG
jgi:hypothetical protein